jgi:hypothetical protein
MMIILFAMFALTDLNTDIISQFSSKYIREPHHFLISIQYSGDGHLRDDQSPYSWTRSYLHVVLVLQTQVLSLRKSVAPTRGNDMPGLYRGRGKGSNVLGASRWWGQLQNML